MPRAAGPEPTATADDHACEERLASGGACCVSCGAVCRPSPRAQRRRGAAACAFERTAAVRWAQNAWRQFMECTGTRPLVGMPIRDTHTAIIVRAARARQRRAQFASISPHAPAAGRARRATPAATAGHRSRAKPLRPPDAAPPPARAATAGWRAPRHRAAQRLITHPRSAAGAAIILHLRAAISAPAMARSGAEFAWWALRPGGRQARRSGAGAPGLSPGRAPLESVPGHSPAALYIAPGCAAPCPGSLRSRTHARV
jgi:hypothetical protein